MTPPRSLVELSWTHGEFQMSIPPAIAAINATNVSSDMIRDETRIRRLIQTAAAMPTSSASRAPRDPWMNTRPVVRTTRKPRKMVLKRDVWSNRMRTASRVTNIASTTEKSL